MQIRLIGYMKVLISASLASFVSLQTCLLWWFIGLAGRFGLPGWSEAEPLVRFGQGLSSKHVWWLWLCALASCCHLSSCLHRSAPEAAEPNHNVQATPGIDVRVVCLLLHLCTVMVGIGLYIIFTTLAYASSYFFASCHAKLVSIVGACVFVCSHCIRVCCSFSVTILTARS